jgi:mono/diheme cytochrome c family protein
MPDFGFDRSDARALTVFLASRSTKAIQVAYLPDRDREDRLKRGREIVSHYNCYGCHTFDGIDGAIRKYYESDPEAAPPVLVGEGKKVQPEWFFDFLKRPIKLRPWLQVRMPSFDMSDPEVAGIVQYFSALDGYELGPVVVESREEAHAAAPEREAGIEQSVDCSACHPPGTGRVPLSHYSVSRRALLPGDIRQWLNESAEPDGAGANSGEARLREFLGVQAN